VKPATQTALLVFADTQNPTLKKNKRAVSYQRSNKKRTEKFVELGTMCKFDKNWQLNNFKV